MVKEHGEGSAEAQKAAKEYNNQSASLQNLQRYIGGVEDDLAKLKEEQRIANSNWTKMGEKLDNASNKMKAFGDKTSEVGKAMSTTVTPAVLGLGTAAGLVAGSYEDSAVRIQNSLGLTAEEAKELTDISRNIYKDGFGESAEEIDTALLQTRQNIKDLNNEELERITKKAVILADTFEADVNEVTRAGNNLMKGFGLESDEAFDLMAKGAQNGLNFSNEMFDNLSEYSGLFARMGFSAEEYFELLQKGSEAGVYNLDYINDVMKVFQIRVKDGSDATSDAMGQMSKDTQSVWKEFKKGDKTVKDVSNAVLKDLKGMDDQVEANQIGVELFGTMWEDLESEAMYSLGGIGDGLEDVDGTMDDMTKNAEKSISKQWASTWREAKEVLLPVGETLLDFTKDVLPEVKEGVEDVTEWFSELDEEGKRNIVMMGGIVAAAGPVLTVVGGLSSGVGGLMKVTGGPVGLAIAGAAGLTLGVMALTKANEENFVEMSNNIEKRREEIDSLDETIARYDELKGKNKLSTDEVLRYMDIMDELKESKSEETIKKLKDEQVDLAKKSGMSKDELSEFLSLNDTLVEKSPKVTEAISEQGNAYAGTAEEAKKLNAAERERLSADLYNDLKDQMDAQTDNLIEQAELAQQINDKTTERNEREQAVIEATNHIREIDKELRDINDDKLGLTIEERDQLRAKREQLESESQGWRNIIADHEIHLADLDKDIDKKKTSKKEIDKQIDGYNRMLEQYESMLLQEQGIVDEKGNAYSSIKDANEALDEQCTELIKQYKSNEINTKEYDKQRQKIDDQVKAINGVQGEADVLNDMLK